MSNHNDDKNLPPQNALIYETVLDMLAADSRHAIVIGSVEDNVVICTNSRDIGFMRAAGASLGYSFNTEPSNTRDRLINTFIISTLTPAMEKISEHEKSGGIDFDHCDVTKLTSEQVDQYIDYQVKKRHKAESAEAGDPCKYWCEDCGTYHDKAIVKVMIDPDSDVPVIYSSVREIVCFLASKLELNDIFIYGTKFDCTRSVKSEVVTESFDGFVLESPGLTVDNCTLKAIQDAVNTDHVWIDYQIPEEYQK